MTTTPCWRCWGRSLTALTAADGGEALRVALHGFDVITTDLDMPHMNGHEFIQRLHDLPVPPIPVVMLTGQLPDESVVECAEPCCVMTKPRRLGELAEMLRLLMTMCSRDRCSCATCPGAVSLVAARSRWRGWPWHAHASVQRSARLAPMTQIRIAFHAATSYMLSA
jgi:CheY-like chemotaxis protein